MAESCFAVGGVSKRSGREEDIVLFERFNLKVGEKADVRINFLRDAVTFLTRVKDGDFCQEAIQNTLNHIDGMRVRQIQQKRDEVNEARRALGKIRRVWDEITLKNT